MAKIKMYTTPIVSRYGSEWFVFFRFWDNSHKKYIQKKISRAGGQDLNRIRDIKDREKEFNALREARETWLQMGWNPLTDPEFKQRVNLHETNKLSDIAAWELSKAFVHVLKFKKLARRSKPEYTKSVDYFIKSAKALDLDGLPIGELSRTHVKAIFANLLLKPFSLSAKNYNKRLCHIKSLLSELEEWKAIEMNPAFRIKELRTEKTTKFIPLDGQERSMVKEYLYLTDYSFYVYCLFLYYTGIRPDEILSIKIKDLDIDKSNIHLEPFSQELKSDKERIVAVHSNLFSFLRQHIENAKPDMFIFSEGFEPGKKRISERSAAYLWNKYVRVELGINKYLYSLKHLGADDFIKAGADEGTVVDHLGHSSKFMTRRYTELGMEKSREVIRKTPIEF